jgi:thiol-disulfide isomerase/thioredoxin
MKAIRLLPAGPVALLAVALAALAESPKSDREIVLTTVKWPALEKAIAAHRGKVVVMDMWANWCIPCKREFHHLVELHDKHAKDGLDCLSLTVDDKDDADKALTFLKKQKAVFGNYLIDETADVWSKKLDVSGPPAVLVFDRSGKKIKTFTSEDPFDYADVEKVILPLLKDNK